MSVYELLLYCNRSVEYCILISDIVVIFPEGFSHRVPSADKLERVFPWKRELL